MLLGWVREALRTNKETASVILDTINYLKLADWANQWLLLIIWIDPWS